MTTKKTIAVLAICLCLSASLACDKGSLETAASDVLASVRAAQPLINDLLPSASDEIQQAVSIAEKLKAAVAANEATGAVEHLSALIPVFQSIVQNDIPQLKDESVRFKVMAALALADIGLHVLANHYKSNQTSPALAKSRHHATTINAFAAVEPWGKQYRRK